VRATKRRADDGSGPGTKVVVFVGETPDWQLELGALLSRHGYATSRVEQLDAVLPLVATVTVQAIVVPASPFAASDLLVFRRIRELSPRTSIVVVTRTPTDPDLKRAFESGATAFLSWPASLVALRHAIERGAPLALVGPRP
jgi:DNA-binding NtrC family response regulator